jgi:hypothetical protein
MVSTLDIQGGGSATSRCPIFLRLGVSTKESTDHGTESSFFSQQQHFSSWFLLPNTETKNEAARDLISHRWVT